jgi:chemotaxis protein histidine kinase CheA
VDVDPELLDLFFSETAANVAAAGPVLSSGDVAAGDLAGVARAFHTLAGTAGLVGHAAWGRFAGDAERLTRRWMRTGEAPRGGADLLRETLAAISAFAVERAGVPPAHLGERLKQAC